MAPMTRQSSRTDDRLLRVMGYLLVVRSSSFRSSTIFHSRIPHHCRTKCMKKKSSPQATEINLPVSKQTAGGVTGAIVGGVLAGPVGAVVGAVAGTIMGNRAAQGKTLVSSGVSDKAKEVVDAAKAKLPGMKKAASKAVAKSSSNPAARSTAAKKAGSTGAATKKAAASKPAGKAKPASKAKAASKPAPKAASKPAGKGTAKAKSAGKKTGK
jgi:hypothetical protein